ncbi:hypothetical protein [Actinomycetospora cinnamomea]|uniref:Uncharacterized protein n=1 Tax=Actinomycetospora cinnamomea TaxID=663609 RepID=A0A2U1EWH7_9PSEU|nr:hypothetical protein [Actinomycetospora cinnamomea]PVZ04285.1 hypothetical protein C8D89_11873 [Actinomycetospora cinnamomea]
MFRRPTSTAATTGTTLRPRRVGDDADRRDHVERAARRARHSRRARRREAVDTAALQARLDRVHRRLVEVGSVQVATRPQAIDNDTARRDPLTRPFVAPRPMRGTAPLAVPRSA